MLQKKPRIIDVAPTILRILGIDPPPSIDGFVLETILDKNVFTMKTRQKSLDREKELLNTAIGDLKI